MRDVTDKSLSLAHAYFKGPDDRNLQPWPTQVGELVDNPGNKQLSERHCPPSASIVHQGRTLPEGSSLLESAGVELVSAGQRAVCSLQETVRGRAADDCSFREHVQHFQNVGLRSIKCSMEGQRDPFAVPLADFQSTTELKSRLLELTKGRDIVYKEKEGDMVLLDNQNWDFFTTSVQEMLIRRHSTKSTSSLCDTVLVGVSTFIIMHTAISL